MIEKNLLTIAVLEGIERSEGYPLCYLWVKQRRVAAENRLFACRGRQRGIRVSAWQKLRVHAAAQIKIEEKSRHKEGTDP